MEEKKALEEALGLVEKAEEICRMAQREAIVAVVTQSMEMQNRLNKWQAQNKVCFFGDILPQNLVYLKSGG